MSAVWPPATRARATCGRPRAPEPTLAVTRSATSSGGNSPSDAVECVCRSTCAVGAFRGGPGGLRSAEQLQQVAIAQLADRGIVPAAPHRGESREATPALGAGALLEHQADLVAAVHRQAPRRAHLPRLPVDGDGAPRHGQASASAASATSVHRSQASGAYVARL